MLTNNQWQVLPWIRFAKLGTLIGCVLGCLISWGCSSAGPSERYTCRVLIDGTVARDVRLTLLAIESGQAVPVYEGSTGPDGMITLTPVDQAQRTSNAAAELVAIVESTGSGEWQLATPYINPKTTPLKIQWPPVQTPFDIQLPRKAIRTI